MSVEPTFTFPELPAFDSLIVPAPVLQRSTMPHRIARADAYCLPCTAPHGLVCTAGTTTCMRCARQSSASRPRVRSFARRCSTQASGALLRLHGIRACMYPPDAAAHATSVPSAQRILVLFNPMICARMCMPCPHNTNNCVHACMKARTPSPPPCICRGSCQDGGARPVQQLVCCLSAPHPRRPLHPRHISAAPRTPGHLSTPFWCAPRPGVPPAAHALHTFVAHHLPLPGGLCPQALSRAFVPRAGRVQSLPTPHKLSSPPFIYPCLTCAEQLPCCPW